MTPPQATTPTTTAPLTLRVLPRGVRRGFLSPHLGTFVRTSGKYRGPVRLTWSDKR